MCGIVGIWNLTGEVVDTGEIDRFTDSLAHRGPDGRGVYINPQGSLGLGHRRLSILDTSQAAAQPMTYGDEQYWLVFNGEIYNFLELRRELEAHGHTFRTESDSEVLLAAFVQWGENCQLKFNGMWAFAIWDQSRQSMFVSRDRFGVKPIHYLYDDKKLVFASELKAFMSLNRNNRPAFDYNMVAMLSNLESVEKTLLEGVKILPAGHQLRLDRNGQIRISKWWNTIDHLIPVASDYKSQIETYRDIFFDSCRIRMRSDVPLATALSGGLDSSSIVCAISKLSATHFNDERLAIDWQRVFILDYVGTSQSEKKYADVIADSVKSRKRIKEIDTNVSIDPDEIIAAIYSLEAIKNAEPMLGPWLLYREMREDGVVVSLDGHGGDELLAGYEDHAESALRDSILPRPDFTRFMDLQSTYNSMLYSDKRETSLFNKLSFGNILYGCLPRKKTLRKWVAKLLKSSPQWIRAAFRFAIQKMNYKNNAAVIPRSGWLRIPKTDPHQRELDLSFAEKQRLGLLGTRLYNDFHFGSLPKILRNFDRASMAHGIESRAPFLDWRLVCMSFSLPSKSKVGDGYTKRILRDSMKGIMPDEIRQRTTKVGFASPAADWYRTALREFILDSINSRQFLESPIWHGPDIRRFVEECYKHERYDQATKSWKYIQAMILMEAFNNTSNRLPH